MFQLTSSDKKKSIEELVEGAAPSSTFYLLLILSTIIVTLGLQVDSSSVVIGGMLVAPLMSPILSSAISIVMADFKFLIQSVKILALAISLVILISFFIGWVSVDNHATNEIMARVNPSMRYFLVAIASGVAAAFGLAHPKLNEVLPGVAVSVALLPPLAVVGLGVALADLYIVTGASLLFFLNLLGIVLAATIVFWFMGFYNEREMFEKKLVRRLDEN